MESAEDRGIETYNPWTLVNVVFTHLADQGLHPTLGEGGDPGLASSHLLTALGIKPAPEGDPQETRDVHEHLAALRAAYEKG